MTVCVSVLCTQSTCLNCQEWIGCCSWEWAELLEGAWVGHIALLYVTVTCVSAHVLTVHRHRGSFFRKPNEAHVSVSLTRLMSLPCMRILYVLVYVICVCEWFYKIHFCKCSNGPVRTNAQIHRWLVFEAAVPRTHKWACRRTDEAAVTLTIYLCNNFHVDLKTNA